MRPAIRTAIRHATPAVVYPLLIPVSFLVSSYLVSKGVSFLYRLVYTCRIRYIAPSGLARRVLLAPSHRPSVEHDIAIVPSASSYISIVFSYPCIFISFIYIAYIIFIIYTHRRDMMNHTPIHKQPVAPPLAPPHPIEWAARDKSDATGARSRRR